jgi:hypothetical protein
MSENEAFPLFHLEGSYAVLLVVPNLPQQIIAWLVGATLTTSTWSLSHAGDAQADFGEALVVIAGVEQKAHFQCIDLPHSDDCFAIAFPAENTEAFLEGHNQAFAYFRGVPRTIFRLLKK